MDVYIFQADIYCESCGKGLMMEIPKPAHADRDDESTYDSDEWPKGPYGDGGGEADCPQHCGMCGLFLENPLTPDGYDWLAESVARIDAFVYLDDDGESIDIEETAAKCQADWDATGRHGGGEDSDAPLAQWVRYYGDAWL